MNRADLLTYDLLQEPADKWLERHVYLSRDSSANAPGRLSLNRQPWARQILRTIRDPHSREVYMVMGAQTGKTTLMLLTWMLFARFFPQPCLIGLSTDPLADRLVNLRLKPMLRDNPDWGRLLPPANKGKSNMVLFPGMPTFYTGARTPDKLASFPAPLLLLDEVSKWQSGSKREAHPFLLVKERVKSFARHKIVCSSTPTVKEDAFYQGYWHSSREHYFMPCPHCGEFIQFEFSSATVRWTPGGTLDDVRRSAHYVCPQCSGEIWDRDKARMMQAGRWEAENAEAPAGVHGYHVNSLYSPYVSFGDVAVEFVKANASVIKTEALRNFYNSWLALPWEVVVKRLSQKVIRELVSGNGAFLKGSLPAAPLRYIVAGMDPGVDGCNYTVCAVEVLPGLDGVKLHVLDWGKLAGNRTTETGEGPGSFALSKTYGDEQIDVVFIDSGYSTADIYAECAAFPPEFLNPCKGTTAAHGVCGHSRIASHPDLQLATYNDTALKTALENMKQERKVVLPNDVDEDFIHGISGQELKENARGERRWKELKDDHYNDCLKLCLLSTWYLLQDVYFTDRAALEEELGAGPPL